MTFLKDETWNGQVYSGGWISPQGGTAAVISFHSGEDRLVKNAFRDGLREGIYARVVPDPVRAAPAERTGNPRSRSAKLRWAVRAA